jgi:hypothetical protein
MLLFLMIPTPEPPPLKAPKRLSARLSIWGSAALLGIALVSFAASKIALRTDMIRHLDGEDLLWSSAPGVPSEGALLWSRLSLTAIALTALCYLVAFCRYHLRKKR